MVFTRDDDEKEDDYESGDVNDDDSNDDDDDDDDDNDDDHHHHHVKKMRTGIGFKHRYGDEVERYGEDKRDDDDTPIGHNQIWSSLSPKVESIYSPQNLLWTMTNNTRKQTPLHTAVNEPNIIIANPEINEKGNRVNTQVNEIDKSSGLSKEKTLNLTDGKKSVVKKEHKNSRQTYRALRFHPIKPVPPPKGFSKTPIPKTGLLSLVLNDTLDHMNYSNSSECPVLGIRRSRNWNGKGSCFQQEVSSEACIRASKEYDLNTEPLKCSTNKSDQPLCSYKVIREFSNSTRTTVECDTTACGTHPVYVLELSPVFGILKERSLWKRFVTSKKLETYLEKYANASSTHGFNFCHLACFRKDRIGYIEQLFIFHSLDLHKTSDSMLDDKTNFNLNILVLDSVSRPHFYRSLPKTVKTLREIVHFETYNATVLDFEMMQSTAAYTFHNIRALMSGKMDFHYSGGHINETYGIDVLFGKFKQLGYYTLLQEDSCWYDSWGSLFTDNKYQGNKPQDKADFARRWQEFRKRVKHYNIDDFGLSHASCEVLKRYNTTNQFNHPKRVCFGESAFADYFLDYTESIYNNLNTAGKASRVLTYTHLNTGHEVSGTRIRQIDERLSRYMEKMATMEDTLTVALSDHGPKTTGYSFHTMEGRAEKYDPFLFIVLPEKVAGSLGLETIRALVQNQNRLITTLDIHKAFMSLGSTVLPDKGIFGLISADRTCANLSMKPLAVCKCDGWEERFPDDDKRFIWLAEFALGNINNNIQEQYLKGTKEIKGYGNCQRLAGKRLSKIRQRSEGGSFITTMDITVTPGNEIFEVQFKHSQSLMNKTTSLKMTQRERITIYRHFSKCVDSTVPLGLCVCDYKPRKRKRHKWVKITSRKDVLDIISLSKSFGAETKVKDIHDDCLLLMYRNHAGRSTSFEISNACNDRTYNVTISTINAGQYFFSRRIPFSISVQQRTVHFLLVVQRTENSSRDFKLKVNHLVEYLKR